LSLFQSSFVSPVERGWGGDGGVAKSYDVDKAWSSINHPILSVQHGICIGILRLGGAGKRIKKYTFERPMLNKKEEANIYVI
jgi:hypothetical protein